jgi:short subunit fatty acids transporter
MEPNINTAEESTASDTPPVHHTLFQIILSVILIVVIGLVLWKVMAMFTPNSEPVTQIEDGSVHSGHITTAEGLDTPLSGVQPTGTLTFSHTSAETADVLNTISHRLKTIDVAAGT